MLTAAALRIVDGEGLDALSMRSWEQSCAWTDGGVSTPPEQGILLDEVVEAVMSEIDIDASMTRSRGRNQLRALALAYLATLMAHPHAAPLIASARCARPARCAWSRRRCGS